jgi:hypothetical protein
MVCRQIIPPIQDLALLAPGEGLAFERLSPKANYALEKLSSSKGRVAIEMS